MYDRDGFRYCSSGDSCHNGNRYNHSKSMGKQLTIFLFCIGVASCASNQVKWNQPNATPEVAQKYTYTLYLSIGPGIKLRNPMCMNEVTIEQSSTLCTSRLSSRINIKDNTFRLTAKNDNSESPKSEPFNGSARFYLMEFYWPNVINGLSTPINLRVQVGQ